MNRREILQGLAATAILPWTSCGKGSSAPVAPFRIALNQVGYLPRAAKVASVALAGGKEAEQHPPGPLETIFRVVAVRTGKAVYEGQLTLPALDAASGDLVMHADFSKLTEPGVFRVETNGHQSDPFDVQPDIYAEALRLAMRSYYGQRCGCAVDLGNGYAHPACHLDAAFHASSGRSGKYQNHGGWHDAGDYGRYIVNSGITCGTLLWAWELFPAALAGLKLDLPESGRGTPDYLAEVRWNLEWMLSMQDADGGVWHKQTSEHFCGFILPQDDRLTSYVIGTGSVPYKSTAATADLAAVMAIAGRCYQPFDAPFAARCVAAAESAYAWAVRNPKVTFTNPHGISTGNYDDGHLGDEPLWAAAELFRTTHKAAYEQAFLAHFGSLRSMQHIQEPGWADVASMGLWTYAMTPVASSAGTRASIHKSTRAAARHLIERGLANGYANTMMLGNYGWGSNSAALNQSLLLFIADRFEPDPAAVNAALGNLHYVLGRNCLGVSWVTGLGARPFQHPHHRPSAADGIAAPWPGLLSGGPNRHPGDRVAAKLPKLPPMRMWADDEGAYSLNEVAINWNAPLVFALAAANGMST